MLIVSGMAGGTRPRRHAADPVCQFAGERTATMGRQPFGLSRTLQFPAAIGLSPVEAIAGQTRQRRIGQAERRN